MRPFLKLPITLPFKLSALVEQLEVVLARVEPLLPTLALPVDWEHTFAAIWKTQNLSGYLVGVDKTPTTRLSDILGVDRQKASLVANTEQFLEGLPANNALLTGSRGTGKSSLIQALLNEYAQAGLRVVQVDKSDLAHLMEIVAALEGQPYRFILFCDDLSFESQDEGYKALKSALDGGVFRSPENILIYATSNRRHLLPEYKSDNTDAHVVNTEIHHTEVVEEKISLSDRFGMWVTFYPINQEAYLSIARHWVAQLSQPLGLEIAWSDELNVLCVRWADNRGTRSCRTAYQFARHWVGQQLLTRKRA